MPLAKVERYQAETEESFAASKGCFGKLPELKSKFFRRINAFLHKKCVHGVDRGAEAFFPVSRTMASSKLLISLPLEALSGDCCSEDVAMSHS